MNGLKERIIKMRDGKILDRDASQYEADDSYYRYDAQVDVLDEVLQMMEEIPHLLGIVKQDSEPLKMIPKFSEHDTSNKELEEMRALKLQQPEVYKAIVRAVYTIESKKE